MATQYSYSTDGENYFDGFDSREEAIAEASANKPEGFRFSVGENVAPTPPENLFTGVDWIEHVACQDDYAGDSGEEWARVITTAQGEELDAEVRAVMAKWLDRHGLRPTFFTVSDVVEYEVMVDGEGVRTVQLFVAA